MQQIILLKQVLKITFVTILHHVKQYLLTVTQAIIVTQIGAIFIFFNKLLADFVKLN
jgi:hypothetical protein